jgi:hypothetical protein
MRDIWMLPPSANRQALVAMLALALTACAQPRPPSVNGSPSTRTSEPLASAPPAEPTPRNAEAVHCGGIAGGQHGASDCELGRGTVRVNPNKLAEMHIRVIRSGVQQWQATNEVTSCPTMSQLLHELMVDKSESGLDPWGRPYTLVCADDEVTVSSSGADGVHGTPDDITVPMPRVTP